jgi:hypothetical protein
MSFLTCKINVAFVAFAITAFLCGGSANAQVAKASAVGGESVSPRIPEGTILPVRLNHGFSSKSRVGTPIGGAIMQAVPLPGGASIPLGAKIHGTIVAIDANPGGAGTTVSFKFDQLTFRHHTLPIAVNLRAMASAMAVVYAQVPDQSLGFGTSAVWADRTQIGGDSFYGVGGEVTDRQNRVVGQGTADGVLVHVQAGAKGACRGPLNGDDHLQAFWVFSADSCGLYDLPNLRVAHAGRDYPVALIELAAPSGQVRVRAGSGMLLRVI